MSLFLVFSREGFSEHKFKRKNKKIINITTSNLKIQYFKDSRKKTYSQA